MIPCNTSMLSRKLCELGMEIKVRFVKDFKTEQESLAMRISFRNRVRSGGKKKKEFMHTIIGKNMNFFFFFLNLSPSCKP